MSTVYYANHPGTGLLVGTDGSVYMHASPGRRVRWTFGYSDWNNHGYCMIMYKNKRYYVHSLVAETFLPNPQNLKQIDHIDRNPANNNVENLRWASSVTNRRNREDVERVTEEGREHIYENEKKRQRMYHYNHFVRDRKKQSEHCRKWRQKYREKVLRERGRL